MEVPVIAARLTTAATLAVLILAAPSVAADVPESYAEANGCSHSHPSKVAYRMERSLLRHHRPTVRKGRVRHYATCVATAAKARAVRRYVARSWAWRHSYAHRWPIVFNRLPAWQQQWAVSTGACESGNNPATNTGNGFHGAHQWLISTWHAAGGTGMPEQHSWHFQAVIAVRWMLVAGDEQWPVCGD